MPRSIFSICLLLSFCFVGLLNSQYSKESKAAETPAPSVREEQQVIVNGVRETWRLQWSEPPAPHCGVDEAETALTCPCMGFAYGESGDLYLIRLRNGTEIDRMHLTPFFEEEGTAVVQRWPADGVKDFELSKRGDFTELVARRPAVRIISFDDYDGDGQRTEFYLQTEALPCGKSFGVVVGLSAGNPRLHAFGTAAKPSQPLFLQKREWQALRDASSNPVSVVDWACGDHGADTQIEVRLQRSAKGIEGVRAEYTCPSNNLPRKLLKEEPL